MEGKRAIFPLDFMSFVVGCLICVFALIGCGGNASASDGSSAESTSGDPFSPPAEVILSNYDASAASGANNAFIDISSATKGYVGAAATYIKVK